MAEYYDPPTALDQSLQQEENRIVNRALSALPEPYLSGLKLNADISLGNLTLNTVDNNDVVWVCTDIAGWWTLPEPEFPELNRGWGDGSYDSIGRYSSRLMTLSGSFLTQNPGQAEVARQTLIDAINLVYSGALLVVNESTTKSSFVRLSGQPEISSVNPRGRHDFSIGLKAADPIKYEYLANTYSTATLSSGGSDTLANAGNTKTPIIFELTGTITGGTITNTYTNLAGASVTETIGGITKSANTYSTEIDTYNRSVVRVDNSTSATTASRGDINTYVDWVQLHPGNNLIQFTTTGGSSQSCKVYYRSGWIG
jgi:hypothetical protein